MSAIVQDTLLIIKQRPICLYVYVPQNSRPTLPIFNCMKMLYSSHSWAFSVSTSIYLRAILQRI